ncbi:MAG TPA: low temperature requirement protein A, partial [Polyangiaceae bacterium]
MTARDPHEAHRVSTPLELLFDLCFVVAVSQAASHLHHATIEGHGVAALFTYAPIFFAIWWAWMNFTWFASAYDADDVPYRLAALVQIAGVLLLAAGVSRAFERGDFTIMALGYAVMRVGLISLWVRAGLANPAHRATAFRYAFGVAALEVVWIAMIFSPPSWALWFWAAGVPLELLVPVWAERKGVTPWHPHHISERYGLLTLIVLGESVLSATNAIDAALERSSGVALPFVGFIVGSILIVFSMWWLYFDQPVHRHLRSNRQAFVWGYGHYLVFATTAALGAGLSVASDFLAGRAAISARTAGSAVAVPLLLYVLSVWILQVRPVTRSALVDVSFVSAAALIYATCGMQAGVLASGVVMAVLVGITVAARASAGRTGSEPEEV